MDNQRLNPIRICLVLSAAVTLTGAAKAQTTASAIDFTHDILPIFQDHCVRCHNEIAHKGDISFTSNHSIAAEDLIRPNAPEQSRLLEMVTPRTIGAAPKMPKKGPPLSKDDVGLLRQGISQGANWPDGVVIQVKAAADDGAWAFRPLALETLPESDSIPPRWRRNPIDVFIFTRLQEHKLQPSPPAEKRALIRRATYDLIGLPPTPAEVERFLADRSPDAYAHLIDRLLASPHYGEQWGRHWLDVIRFGESRGFERNEIIRNAWPFRDYIIRAFNTDKPFRRLVLEHLAGDVIGKNNPDVEVGTTFLVCGPYDDVGNQDPAQAAQIRANTIDEMIRATAGAFLGLTVGCARCHDHKFDPITQKDYYGWYASFAGVHHGSRVVATQAQKDRHARQVAPLRRQQTEGEKAIRDLEQQLFQRASKKADPILARFTRPPINRGRTEEVFSPIQARFVRLMVEGTERNPAARSGYTIDEFEVWTAGDPPRNVALASRGGTAQGQSRVAKDFADAYSPNLTIDGEFGARWLAAGPELRITLAAPQTINRVVFSSDRTGDAGGHGVASFLSEYRIEVSLDGQRWTEVANSHDRQPINQAHRRRRLIEAVITQRERDRRQSLREQIARVSAKLNAIPPLPAWWAGTFRETRQIFHVFKGGNPQRPGAEVVPASLSALNGIARPYQLSKETPEGQRRLQLAKWIVAPDNPLTLRVLANRIWQYHFGTGIVDSPSDFGAMGGRPTHPKLLDWLALQLQANGWRLKPIHKLIMMSQTYRQAATRRDAAAQIDGDSRYLWRFPPRRLSAEEIRDTILSIAGELDDRMGGPGFQLYRYLQDNVATYLPLDRDGPETYRRTVYHHNARAAFVDLLTEFDGPDNAFATPRRISTTTPLQALTLMNHSFTLDMANFFARRLRTRAPHANAGAAAKQAFLLAYARSPSPRELERSKDLIGHYGLRAFCRALINSNELIYLH